MTLLNNVIEYVDMSVIEVTKSKIRKFYRICCSCDWALMFHLIFNRIKYRHFQDFLRADWPHKSRFLYKYYGYLLENCRKNPQSGKVNSGPIWVFWWQGEDKMPELVRFCYESLKRNAPTNRPLVFVHQDNYREYTDIPEYIIEKLKNGYMNLTHFSDIVRMSLLAKHGGLWVDCTVYVNGPIPDSIFEHSYFSGREPFMPYGVKQMDYTLYLIGASAGAPWVVYARDVLYEYWKNSWELIDYFLISLILEMPLDSVPELKKEVLEGVLDMPHANTLQDNRDEPCSFEQYENIMRNGLFFKLSYKLKYKERDENGNLTHYGMMRHTAERKVCD